MQQQMPKGLEGEDDEHARFERRREKESKRNRSGKRKNIKDRDWILKKKKVSRMQTKDVCPLTVPLVVSPTRKGRGSKRFKVHWPQAQGNFLDFPKYLLNERWTFVVRHHKSTYFSSSFLNE